MSKKQFHFALCGLFILLILGGMAVLNLCWPDRKFSPMENRYPGPAAGLLLEGSSLRLEWTQDFGDLPHRPHSPCVTPGWD